jgi:hypothetical protein
MSIAGLKDFNDEHILLKIHHLHEKKQLSVSMNKSSTDEESSGRTNAIYDVFIPSDISPCKTEQLNVMSDYISC